MGDHADEWEFQRIGTESEKSSVEKELAELRERLAKVEEWKKRKGEIEEELNPVWVEGKEEDLAPPPYLESEADTSEQGTRNDEEAVESGSEGVSDGGQ
jgi:ATP-binding cassette subfamily D (ALD) long-chain fatty acid import protein